jgi:asparagine synthase (glutamine-hydrolysing)
MCGFVGGVFKRPTDQSDLERLTRAVGDLQHRGPDAQQVVAVSEGPAILGFSRLAIIDIAGGDQPMSTGRGQHIVFNGEIYNYRELRAGLADRSVPLRTRSDTEALLWHLTLDGVASLSRLVGMFGFAFLDTRHRTLVLGRDRLGIKQVYYTETPDGFFFASEPKALVRMRNGDVSLNEEQVPAYFGFRAVPAPNTLFREIKKLPSGCVLLYSLDTQEFRVERYWQTPPTTSEVPFRHALDRFEDTFLEAVRSRLVADVPVGAFLSGGLDSSLVVAAMRRLGHPDLRTFSATFPGHKDDEGAFARRVAARFGTRHFELPTEAHAIVGSLPRWIELNDDLVADASSLPLLGVAGLARDRGCIVLLSGEGSDELFAGYGSQHKFVGLNWAHRILGTKLLRTGLLEVLSKSGMLSQQDRPRATEYLVKGGGFMGTAAQVGPDDLRRMLSPLLGDREITLPRASGNRLVDLCAFDFVTRIPEDLMVRTDRATMGASIEARVPFLDHRLVELVFQLAPASRAIPGVSKVLPRLLAHRWGVPLQTVYHRKIGFQLPIGDWFRNELAPMWRAILKERLLPVVDYDTLAGLVNAHNRGQSSAEEFLWRVAALELWYRRWIERRDASELVGSPGDALGRSSLIAA